MESSNAKDRLNKAFTELMKQKPYKKITVSALVSLAGVNRSTFYRYYENTDALFLARCGELIEKILSPFATVGQATSFTCEQIYALWSRTLKNGKKYEKELLLFSGENGNVDILLQLRSRHTDRMIVATSKCSDRTAESVKMAELSSEIFVYRLLQNGKSKWLSEDKTLFIKDFSLDKSKTLAENVANYIQCIGLGNEEEIYGKVFPSLFNQCIRYHLRSFHIKEFMHEVGYSRTYFYRFMKNDTMFVSTFFTCFANVITRYILEILKNPEVPVQLLIVKREGKLHRGASRIFKDSQNESILLDFFISVYGMVTRECEKNGWLKKDDEWKQLYICEVIHGVRYYLIDYDEEALVTSQKDARRLLQAART